MDGDGIRKALIGLGILAVVAGIGVAVYTATRRPSPESIPKPLAAEFKELSAVVVGKALPDGRGLTQAQLDEMLYSSAGHGSAGMVSWLLLQGANPRANAKDRGYQDRSALREAARNRHCENETLLIKRIGDIARSSASGTAEQQAARIAEDVANFVNESDSHWISPLHDAVEGGERECVAALLAAGARVDSRDGNGVTPLALARRKQYNHLVPMLTAALEKQDAGEASATTADTTSSADKGKDEDVKGSSIAAVPAITGSGVRDANPSWQALGQIAGMFRLEIDRSGSMPTGQGRVRFVAEENGHLAGKGITFEYDCAERTLHNLTSGDWVDDRIVDEKPEPAADKRWASKHDDSSQVILNALCGVAIDTGRALGASEGWKPLGTFEGKELEILPATRTAKRGQYRLGTSGGGGFSGAGWLFELDCEGHGLRALREQIWKDGAMTRDEAALANTWNSTERSDFGRAIYGAVCPRQ